MIAATHLVRLALGPVSIGLDMGRVLGIERGERMKPAKPGSDIVGRIQNRAGDWPVLDLAARLGLPRERPNDESQVVLTAIAGERRGLLVDRTAPVPRSTDAPVRPVPASIPRGESLYEGVVVLDGRPLLLLDPDRLTGNVDLFALDPRSTPPTRRATKPTTRCEQLFVLGQYEYPLPGDRIVGFGLPLALVAGVIDAPPGTPVPGAPAHIRELSSWRGRSLPVVDLADWCGLRVPAQPNRRTVVVRTSTGDPLGLPAGRGVRVLPLPIPNVVTRRTFTYNPDRVLGVFDTNEQTLIIPDLAQLAAGL
jgi:chemotaxis signal transduction protein